MRRKSARRRRECGRIPGHDDKRRTVAPEELLQVFQASGIVFFDRCARRDDAQLRRVRCQPDPVQKSSQEVTDLRAGGAAVTVKFIDDKVEKVVFVGRQPSAGGIKDAVLDAPHQHDVQHAVVRDEDVGRRVLHVPAGPHLGAVRILEVVEDPRIGSRRGRESGAVPFQIHVVEPPSKFVPLRVARPRTGYGGDAGVSAEPEAVAPPVLVEPLPRGLTVAGLSYSAELVLDQRV